MSRVEEALRRAADGGDALPRTHLGDTAMVEAEGSVPIRIGDYPAEDSDGHAQRRRELPRTAIAAPRASTVRALTRLDEEVDGKVVIDVHTPLDAVEQYRRLAAALHQQQASGKLKTLMIASALPRDGKTLTATNLALTLSESFKRRVLLIDADLRRPSIHTVFRLPNTRGLADGLRSDNGQMPLIEVTPKLTILPAGGPDHSPMAGLSSARMQAVLSEGSERFDWVLIDTAPIGVIADGHLLAGLVDGVVLVISAGITEYAAVKRTVEELGNERILGVVLNRVRGKTRPASGYEHYYANVGSGVGERGVAP